MKKGICIILALACAMTSFTALAQGEVHKESGRGVLPAEIKLRPSREDVATMSNEELPKTFDLRNVDGVSYVSSVKDQGSTNNCWAYALVASAESCWLKQTNGREEVDLSEHHLDYATNYKIRDQINPDGAKETLNRGGEAFFGAASITKGTGFVLEEDFSGNEFGYTGYTGNEGQAYLSDLYQKPAFGIDEVRISNYFDGFEEIETDGYHEPDGLDDEYYKAAILKMKNDLYQNKTAISVNILSDYDYYGEKYPAFYNPHASYHNINHGIVVVGWDDEYSAENFNVKPKGDGAWIVKDSYGTEGVGREEGFMYVSYYDLGAYYINTQVTKMSDLRNGVSYDNRYYHDKSWFVKSLGYEDNGNVIYGMNVFEKQSGTEYVESVNLGFNGPTEYEVYIADVSTYDGVNVDELTPCLSGSVSDAGYYQLYLDTPVKVSGDRFEVVVKYYDEADAEVLPVSKLADYPFWWYDTILEFNEGESFISPDGKMWEDLAENNQCCAIKAFTTDAVKKTNVTFNVVGDEEAKRATMVWVEDLTGTSINPNADGTYSLVEGTYRYRAERSYSAGQYGAETYYADVWEFFDVSGEEMIIDVDAPSEEEALNCAPGIEKNELIECYPYVYPECYISHNYGAGNLAATDATVYLEYEDGTRELLTKGTHYSLSDYAFDFEKLLNDDFLYDMQGHSIMLEIQYNDDNNTTEKIYVNIKELDIAPILNAYIYFDKEVTKKDIEEFLYDIKGTESVKFSDDFKITCSQLNGSVTVVNGGKTHVMDYTDYNRCLAKLKFVKKTKTGEMYKCEILPLSEGGYDWSTVQYAVEYENGVKTKYTPLFAETYMDVEYGKNPKTFKLFHWLYGDAMAPSGEVLEVEITGTVE